MTAQSVTFYCICGYLDDELLKVVAMLKCKTIDQSSIWSKSWHEL